jgi:hypothetical protein
VVSVLGLGCFSVSMLERFQTLEYQPFRGVLFAALGLWGAVPLSHQLLFTWQAAPTPLLTAVLYEAIMGVCYLTVRARQAKFSEHSVDIQ